jgi:hypothetical protein
VDCCFALACWPRLSLSPKGRHRSKPWCVRRTLTADEIQSRLDSRGGGTCPAGGGNPRGATGAYAVRLKMPDNYKIAPYWHPKRENDLAEFAADIPASPGLRLLFFGN